MNNNVTNLFHARSSQTSRAASLVKISEVTPADLARSVLSSADQYSAGILSLWCHLETCVAETWGNSAAKAKRDSPHSSMIARNEVKSVMTASIGQSVLKSKAMPSLDCGSGLGHNVQMADSDTELQFKQEFTGRIKTARVSLGWKQWQMAEALGMPQDKYKQYEGRSLLPHHLIGRFCLVTHVDPEWLLTGRGEKPLQGLRLASSEPKRQIVKPKRATGKRSARG